LRVQAVSSVTSLQTQTTLTTLIMTMILYPEVQERAQAMIDRVVGRDRLPTFNDRGSLQYIDALLRETMRWGSLVPMGTLSYKRTSFSGC